MMIKSIFLMIFFGLMNVFTPTDLTDLHRFSRIYFFNSHGLPTDAQPKTEGLKSV